MFLVNFDLRVLHTDIFFPVPVSVANHERFGRNIAYASAHVEIVRCQRPFQPAFVQPQARIFNVFMAFKAGHDCFRICPARHFLRVYKGRCLNF